MGGAIETKDFKTAGIISCNAVCYMITPGVSSPGSQGYLVTRVGFDMVNEWTRRQVVKLVYGCFEDHKLGFLCIFPYLMWLADDVNCTAAVGFEGRF